MFTGIIKNTGKISKIYKNSNNCTIEILSKIKFSKYEIGSSVSCSGTCLTLEKYKKNDDDTWSTITTNQGSVEHLDFLTRDEKDVFKTAFEIDQKWIVELGADRTPYISQAQSINIFLPADVHKKELHQIHFQAWKKGLKSLYYCRSKSIQRAENVNDANSTDINANVYKSKNQNKDQTEYEECLSCQ